VLRKLPEPTSQKKTHTSRPELRELLYFSYLAPASRTQYETIFRTSTKISQDALPEICFMALEGLFSGNFQLSIILINRSRSSPRTMLVSLPHATRYITGCSGLWFPFNDLCDVVASLTPFLYLPLYVQSDLNCVSVCDLERCKCTRALAVRDKGYRGAAATTT
jgi:hypothetical protein